MIALTTGLPSATLSCPAITQMPSGHGKKGQLVDFSGEPLPKRKKGHHLATGIRKRTTIY